MPNIGAVKPAQLQRLRRADEQRLDPHAPRFKQPFGNVDPIPVALAPAP